MSWNLNVSRNVCCRISENSISSIFSIIWGLLYTSIYCNPDWYSHLPTSTETWCSLSHTQDWTHLMQGPRRLCWTWVRRPCHCDLSIRQSWVRGRCPTAELCHRLSRTPGTYRWARMPTSGLVPVRGQNAEMKKDSGSNCSKHNWQSWVDSFSDEPKNTHHSWHWIGGVISIIHRLFHFKSDWSECDALSVAPAVIQITNFY